MNIRIIIISLLSAVSLFAGEIDDKTVVAHMGPRYWHTFNLDQVRLLPGSAFYHAMQVSKQYLLDTDINRFFNHRGYQDPAYKPYPGSNQPKDTRPAYADHYISGISLMYAQAGDMEFKKRCDYIMKNVIQRAHNNPNRDKRIKEAFARVLSGTLGLVGPDEFGYPWGGMGNFFYGMHKWHAAYRDAYLYCGNEDALKFWIEQAEYVTEFVLAANPDIFDGMLDIEHGGMNETFADLYAITGDKRYLEVSKKFNHQKVILNVALGNDVLYGRHANMQVPTFVGTARQYQLDGNHISFAATDNFIDMVLHDHATCIGGNSRYERFGRPGEITTRLGYSACETCNTYNMLKVALEHFQSTDELSDMNYYERALYNHILASQDPVTGGVTYYTSLTPGSFKSYSDRFNLRGVWCCVGTGMENHSQYGRAIYFNNDNNLLVNLFIPSTLKWADKGLVITQKTSFPASNLITFTIDQNRSFDKQIFIRKPVWCVSPVHISHNGKSVAIESDGDYISLSGPFAAGDKITLELPQSFYIEQANDDPHMVTIFHGPLALACQLGTDHMPGSDQVETSFTYKDWVPYQDDIPTLVAGRGDISEWIQASSSDPLKFIAANAGLLNGKKVDIAFRPFHLTHNQRYSLYLKMFEPSEYALRSRVVSDEIDTSNIDSENAHNLSGKKHYSSTKRDKRNFWENNRPCRMSEPGGWFSYSLKLNPAATEPQYLTVTYWGGSDISSVFDIYVDDKLLKTEDMHDRAPLTFLDENYEFPAEWVKGKDSVVIRFQAHTENNIAGPVFALKASTDPFTFRSYSFYEK